MMVNQCDGCKLHMPIKNGLHYQGGHPYMSCTKDRYPDYELPRAERRHEESGGVFIAGVAFITAMLVGAGLAAAVIWWLA